jgi:hypothetical protein
VLRTEKRTRRPASSQKEIHIVSERTDTIENKEKYAAVIQLIVGTDAITWNRFYNYLVFASVLILAWFVMYNQATQVEVRGAREGPVVQLQRPTGAPIIMTVMSALGGLADLLGHVWGGGGEYFWDDTSHWDAKLRILSRPIRRGKPSAHVTRRSRCGILWVSRSLALSTCWLSYRASLACYSYCFCGFHGSKVPKATITDRSAADLDKERHA